MYSRSYQVCTIPTYSLILAILIFVYGLVGCDATNFDATDPQQDIHNYDNNLNQRYVNKRYCESAALPFAYNLCHVPQAQLSTNPNGKGLHLKLFWRPQNKAQTNDTTPTEPLYKFEALKGDLPANESLIFAVNAGMYNEEFAPIGYTVIRGKEILSLNLNEGGGNFHLMPNGVFWWNKAGKVHITESKALNAMLEKNEVSPWFATQSGPMLVIDGNIHPKFNKDSTSLKFRNGVGVCTDGQVKFVNSDEPVNFYQFASLFKDKLGCPDALFLDGGVASALYAPEINIEDSRNMGVMAGLVENK